MKRCQSWGSFSFGQFNTALHREAERFERVSVNGFVEQAINLLSLSLHVN